MIGVLASATLKTALAGWLLLTNLSLGLYHRHEAGEAAHRAAPSAWHYHVLLLGVELDFLSCNAESSPFQSPSTPDGEAHLLLGNLVAPATDHDVATTIALLVALLPLAHQPPCDLPDALESVPGPLAYDVSGLPPPISALTARSGVQQI
jgi:hypothetical protein